MEELSGQRTIARICFLVFLSVATKGWNEAAAMPIDWRQKIHDCETPLTFLHRSCKEIKENCPGAQDGLHLLHTEDDFIYQTFCDMTMVGSGWTLVSNVHEDFMAGKCMVGDC